MGCCWGAQELVCVADSEVEAVVAYRNALENALGQPAAAHPVEGYGAANLSLAQARRRKPAPPAGPGAGGRAGAATMTRCAPQGRAYMHHRLGLSMAGPSSRCAGSRGVERLRVLLGGPRDCQLAESFQSLTALGSPAGAARPVGAAARGQAGAENRGRGRRAARRRAGTPGLPLRDSAHAAPALMAFVT